MTARAVREGQAHQIAARAVVRSVHLDPERPAWDVEGMRRNTTINRMLASGELEVWQGQVAERYCRLWERAVIGTTPDTAGAGAAAWQRAGAVEARMCFNADLRAANTVLGSLGQQVMCCVACAGMTLADTHARLWPSSVSSRQHGAAVVKGVLLSALSALGERWGMAPQA